jgi:hypothetical protein
MNDPSPHELADVAKRLEGLAMLLETGDDATQACARNLRREITRLRDWASRGRTWSPRPLRGAPAA